MRLRSIYRFRVGSEPVEELVLSFSCVGCASQASVQPDVKTIIVSKMTSHCAGTVQMREESETGIRNWEEMWFKTKTRAEDGEGGAALTCDGRLFHRRAAATGNVLSPTVDRRIRRTSRVVDEAERNRRLDSVSAGRRRYVGARPCWHLYARTATLLYELSENIPARYFFSLRLVETSHTIM